MLGAHVPVTILLLCPPHSGRRSENTVAQVTRVSGVVFQTPQLSNPSALQNYRFGNTASLHSCLSLRLGLKVTQAIFRYLLSFLGTHGGGRWETKESGTAATKAEFSYGELHALVYLVGLLPAAGLGVHVYRIFCPVSLNVELLRNLWMREADAKC